MAFMKNPTWALDQDSHLEPKKKKKWSFTEETDHCHSIGGGFVEEKGRNGLLDVLDQSLNGVLFLPLFRSIMAGSRLARRFV